MTDLMMTVQWPGKAPTIDEIQQRFSLTNEEISKSFGVVEVDPDEHIYTFLVKENAVSKIQSRTDVKVKGPYSNPQIGPFGPPDESP